MNYKYKLTLFLACMFSTQLVFAASKDDGKIFKCTNSKGSVFYNDRPCPKNNKEKKLRAVKDPKGGVSSGVSVNSFVNNEQNSSETYGSLEEKIAVEAIDAEIENIDIIWDGYISWGFINILMATTSTESIHIKCYGDGACLSATFTGNGLNIDYIIFSCNDMNSCRGS